MRKTIALLAALVSLAAAGTASADVPYSETQFITTQVNAGTVQQSCATRGTIGTWMSSIGGWYHDGCSTRLRCWNRNGCDARTLTAINRSSTADGLAPYVSQNARIRVHDSSGVYTLGYHDRSCYASPRCQTQDYMRIGYLQYGSIQCNGVHYMTAQKAYYNYCELTMSNT